MGAVLVGFLAVLTTVGVISYLFTWWQDQSMLSANEYWSEAATAKNHSGAFGFAWGWMLVDRCFGLAAIIPCIFLVIIAVKLFTGRALSWTRIFAYLFFGTLLLSVMLGFATVLTSDAELYNMFGGGIGGGCGYFLAASLVLAMGLWGTAALLFCLLIVFIYLTSTRFETMIVNAMDRKSVVSVDAVVEGQAEAYVVPAADEMPVLVDEAADEAVDEVADEAGEEAGDGAKGGYVAVGDLDAGDVAVGNVGDDDQRGNQNNGNVETVDTFNPVDAQNIEINITGPEEELITKVEEELPKLDIRSDVDNYSFPPPLDLLEDYADKRYSIPKEEIDGNIEIITTTLASFRIPVQGISASVGYTVTLYRISLGEGVRVNTVRNLEDDIAIKIGIKGVRVVMLADAVGIEVPNQRPSVVPLKAILNSDAFRNLKGELPIALGYTIMTKAKVFDLADAPHLLVAGATKQGKSVGLNAIISSLLYSKHPTELKFVFIDPKMVEFQKYSKLFNHYLALLPPLDDTDEAESAIVKDPKNAESVLRALCVEMDQRYALLSAAGVNKVTDYNEKFRNRHLRYDEGHHFMPYLVVVVDEYADLTKSGNDRNLSRSIENSINRLAAKGRAAGLHVIIATQRPSVDVITGTIKGNFPTRMAFRTAQRQDSQTILGMPGAEKLIGKGDMLFFTGADAERVQCALVDTDEIERLTSFISKQKGFKQCCSKPYYLPDPGEMEGSAGAGGESGGLIDMKNLDSMFEEAAKLVVMNGGMSTTMLQRKLQLGFARAGRIMDQLQAAGVVGPQQGARPREALVSDLASLQSILDAYMK